MLAGAVSDGGQPPRLMRSAGCRHSNGGMGACSEEDADGACAPMRDDGTQLGADALPDVLGQRTIPALMGQRRKVRNSYRPKSKNNDLTDQLMKASSPSSVNEIEAFRPVPGNLRAHLRALILFFFLPLGP